MASKGKQLRDLLNGDRILVSFAVYDTFSARLVESMGYRTATISGAGLSESRLGRPDRGFLGYEDNVRAARDIAATTDLLIQADADTGYGNAVNVYYVVRGFESAGLAAVMIEDQVWPKRCGHFQGKDIIPAEEMVQKIKAATDARRDPDFLIKARTDAAGVAGVDEAIRRLNMYAEAGADYLLADALLSVDDIRKVAKNVTKPLAVNMGFGIRSRPTTPLVHPKELEAMGVSQVVFSRFLSGAALRGMKNAFGAFNDMLAGDRTVDRPDLVASFAEINEVVGIDEVDTLERRYAVPGQSGDGFRGRPG